MSQQQKRERNCTHMEFIHCYAKEDPTFDRRGGGTRELKRLNQLCRQRTSENALSFDHMTAYPGVICEKPRPTSPERDAQDLLEKDASKRPFTPNPRSTLKHIGRTEKQAMHDPKEPITVSKGPATEELIGNFKNLTLEQKSEIDDLKKVPYDAVCKEALGNLNSLYRSDFGKDAKSEDCGAFKVPRPVQPETTTGGAGTIQPSRHDLKLAHALSTELKRAETKRVELNTKHDELAKTTPRYPPIQYGRKARPATAGVTTTLQRGPDQLTPRSTHTPSRVHTDGDAAEDPASPCITPEQAAALGMMPTLVAAETITMPPTPPSRLPAGEDTPTGNSNPKVKKIVKRPNTARNYNSTVVPNENQMMTNSGFLVEKKTSASISPRRVPSSSLSPSFQADDGASRNTSPQGSPRSQQQSPRRPTAGSTKPGNHSRRNTRNKKSSHTTNPLKRLAATSAPGITKSVPAVPPCTFIGPNPGDAAAREKKFVALTKTFFSQQGRFLPYHPSRVNTSGRGQ